MGSVLNRYLMLFFLSLLLLHAGSKNFDPKFVFSCLMKVDYVTIYFISLFGKILTMKTCVRSFLPVKKTFIGNFRYYL